MLTIALALDGAAREKFLSQHDVGELERLAGRIRLAYAGWGRKEPQHFQLLRQVERSVSGWIKVKREPVTPVVSPPVVPPVVPTSPKGGWNPPSQRRLAVTR